jgi:hypothetical protein
MNWYKIAKIQREASERMIDIYLDEITLPSGLWASVEGQAVAKVPVQLSPRTWHDPAEYSEAEFVDHGNYKIMLTTQDGELSDPFGREITPADHYDPSTYTYFGLNDLTDVDREYLSNLIQEEAHRKADEHSEF